MATSTICFNGQLTPTTLGEAYCDLTFTPPSNLSGKLCYVEAKGFTFCNQYTGKQGWHTFLLYNNWQQVYGSHVDYNPSAQDSGNFSCSRTINNNILTNVSPAHGIVVGTQIRGSGIPSGTTVTGVSGSTITLSANQTGSTGDNIGLIFFSSDEQQQKARVPLAAFNEFGQQSFTTLVQIPDGPHNIRFTVKRADKGIIVTSYTQTICNFWVVFNIVPANSRPTPLN